MLASPALPRRDAVYLLDPERLVLVFVGHLAKILLVRSIPRSNAATSSLSL